jgi:putative oxidoreductase
MYLAGLCEFANKIRTILDGGILLVIGYRTRLVGLVLALRCVAAGVVAHSRFADQNQIVHFLKNIAMAGGFLQLFAFGAGGWAVDARREKPGRV